MGAILNRSCDTRQRDYRKADTDVGADVNETAGHFGPPDPLNDPTHINLAERCP
jgi:hypothetical protein